MAARHEVPLNPSFRKWHLNIRNILNRNNKLQNLARIDMPLLLLFEALLAEGNLTRAAARIGMAQPSASKALDRLRDLFADPLFLRAPGGMRATPRALCPLCSHLPCMACGRTARLARCRVGLRRSSARPTHTFLGAREDFFVYGGETDTQPALSRPGGAGGGSRRAY